MEVTVTRSMPKILVLVAALFLAAVASGGGGIGASPIGHTHEAVFAYRDAHPGEAIPVIVQTSADADAAATVAGAGGTVYSDLGFIHGVAAGVPASGLDRLATADDVSWISLDAPVSSTDGGSSSTSQIVNVFNQEIQADVVGKTGDLGQGVGIAVVDTGIYAANDFK